MKRKRIDPEPISSDISLSRLIDHHFLAYNSARLREACQLLRKILSENAFVGMSLSGALTPAGLGKAAITPLIEAGFVDYIVSTGANLYHDLHFAQNQELFASSPFADDLALRDEKLIRIYDIVMDQQNLFDTDQYVARILALPEFRRSLSTAELHHLLGKAVAQTEEQLGIKYNSILAAAYRHQVPIYSPSPGDSAIGMNLASLSFHHDYPRIDIVADVNETAAIVYEAKKTSTSAVIILGGGSPKNFLLQTEPQLQEILGLDVKGHDYFVQITDARPDTGGLSGATPSEAVTWGKVDPDMLPNAVVCYLDSTVALPLLTAYLLTNCPPRSHRRLYGRREELVGNLRKDYGMRAGGG